VNGEAALLDLFGPAGGSLRPSVGAHAPRDIMEGGAIVRKDERLLDQRLADAGMIGPRRVFDAAEHVDASDGSRDRFILEKMIEPLSILTPADPPPLGRALFLHAATLAPSKGRLIR
jgi:hypothetical protein